MAKFYTFQRKASDGDPGGITVSKRPRLPDGDFRLQEYVWGPCSLWFVVDDKFTAAERREARKMFGPVCVTPQ